MNRYFFIGIYYYAISHPCVVVHSTCRATCVRLFSHSLPKSRRSAHLFRLTCAHTHTHCNNNEGTNNTKWGRKKNLRSHFNFFIFSPSPEMCYNVIYYYYYNILLCIITMGARPVSGGGEHLRFELKIMTTNNGGSECTRTRIILYVRIIPVRIIYDKAKWRRGTRILSLYSNISVCTYKCEIVPSIIMLKCRLYLCV